MFQSWIPLGFVGCRACTHQTVQLVRASTTPYSRQIENLKSPALWDGFARTLELLLAMPPLE